MARKASRSGLRIRGERVRPEVRRALVRFARWVRQEYDFPIRVPVYLHSAEYLTTRDGRRVVASFFAPFDRKVEPYIRIATGDYPKLKAQSGRDDALAALICSFAHEVIHYQQWTTTGDIWERGEARRAVAMLDAYARAVDRP